MEQAYIYNYEISKMQTTKLFQGSFTYQKYLTINMQTIIMTKMPAMIPTISPDSKRFPVACCDSAT